MKNITYINAGAGSGKTFCLTKILTQLIKEGKAKPDEVILTTFTTKAANEFKEKAKAFLFDEGLFDEAIQLDNAMIGTVHSVCQRMIGKYWFNLGLSPNMGVMAEEDTRFYISQSLAELPEEDELKLMHAFAREFDLHEVVDNKPKTEIYYDFWQDQLKNIINFATNYEIDDFSKSEVESLAFIEQFVKPGISIDITDEELDAMLQEARSYVQNSNKIKKKEEYYKNFDKIKRTSWNKTISWYKDVQKNLGSKYGETCSAVMERLSYMWHSKEVYVKQEKYIKLLFDLAKRWKENFAEFKREKNLLDYNDMEKYMHQLMGDHSIAKEISMSYRYLFVDEYQDSSPIQFKIFDALSDLMEHSYWVGDYKQAIYGFRGSDTALTKAVVDRISMKTDGCDTRTLDTSWRSLPDIVDLDNKVFCKTFAGVLSEENIHLKQHRENANGEESLRYFVSNQDFGVAQHIYKLLAQGADPNEIAVLARANKTLGRVESDLKNLKIPCSREDISAVGTNTYSLVNALLRIILSGHDSLAKASVAWLTEPDYSIKKIIEEKILNDSDEEKQHADYLADIPLVKRVLSCKSRLQQESVASLVESMIIELNLYNEAKKTGDAPGLVISSLQSIISSARLYEDHCVQMNLPATIDGFISYIEEMEPTGVGDPNGVQLHTYHSCKGLQWKYVILMSLNENVANVKKALRGETYGVHSIPTEVPSAENPYPEMYIRLTPWVYGNAKTIPDEISAKIEGSQEFQRAYTSMLQETNRVLYVGMTRPADVLLLDIEEPKKGAKLLQWFKDEGLEGASDTIPEYGDWDILGTGHNFTDFTITEEEAADIPEFVEDDLSLYKQLDIAETTYEAKSPRYLSPSNVHSCGKVEECHDFKVRIPLGKKSKDMATIGDCIHQIFAGIEEKNHDFEADASRLIESYGLTDVLTDRDSILTAWRNLYAYLSDKYGTPTKTYHERPFRMERDGQTIVGSIDLVWQTEEGDVLVDFKTCPMGPDAVLDESNDHYAGWYAGQLDSYQDALEAAGEKVLKRYIYYSVSGLLVEIIND